MNATAGIERLAGVLPLASIIPFPDLLLGGVLLVAVVLIHGIGIRLVGVHFRKRSDVLAWRARRSDPPTLAAPPRRCPRGRKSRSGRRACSRSGGPAACSSDSSPRSTGCAIGRR